MPVLDPDIARLAEYYSSITTPKGVDVLNQVTETRNNITLNAPDAKLAGELFRVINNSDRPGARRIVDLIKAFDNIAIASNVARSTLNEKVRIIPQTPGTHGTTQFDPIDSNTIATDNEKIGGIYTVGASPASDKMRYATFMVSEYTSSPQTLGVDRTMLFMNTIPSFELARCVPYLEIKVITNTPTISNKHGHPQVGRALSIYRILLGDSPISTFGDTTTAQMIGARDLEIQAEADGRTVAGMEIFTSPQTMLPLDAGKQQRWFHAPIIDRMRPFMSIERFSVESYPAGAGIMDFRMAKLQLRLHDRSRLADVANFIHPDFYSSSRIQVTYGWSHPDERNNVYGKLIKSLRRTELYQPHNSQFTFTKNGEVSIDVDMSLLGLREIARINISLSDDATGKRIRDALETVAQLGRRIAELKSAAVDLSEQQPLLKQLKPSTILTGAENPLGRIEVEPEFQKDLESFLSHFPADTSENGEFRASNEKLAELIEKMRELYGQDGTVSDETALGRLNKEIDGALALKLSKITSGHDPYVIHRFVKELGLESLPSRANEDIKSQIDEKKKLVDFVSALPTPTAEHIKLRAKTKKQIEMLSKLEIKEGSGGGGATTPLGTKFVSLGKLIQIFVLDPLATTNRFSEVHAFYYPLNRWAGRAGGLNLASFMINAAEFRAGFTKFTKSRGKGEMSIRDFIRFLGLNYLDDLRSHMYGVNSVFKPRDMGNPLGKPQGLEVNEEGEPPVNDSQKENKLYKSQFERALEGKVNTLGEPADRKFHAPHISFMIESLPAARKLDEATGQTTGADGLPILRIHIYDDHATPYDNQAELWDQIVDTRIQNAESIADLIGKIGENKQFSRNTIQRALVSAQGIKDIIRGTMPSVRFGTNNTMVVDATLKSITDQRISDIHLIQAGKASALEPKGVNEGSIPLRVHLATLDMSLIGCPTLSFGQQFFIDFDTNTTADNIYGITGKVSHDISPGRFESKIQCYAVDTYGKYETLRDQLGIVLNSDNTEK